MVGTDANKKTHGVMIECKTSLHLELELLVASGVSTCEDIHRATPIPARIFRLSDRGAFQKSK